MPAPAEFDRLRVVLVGSRNPLNIGAAARAMTNFGFRRLRMVNPYEIAFREARSAIGAASLLQNAEEYNTLAKAVADCSLVVGTTALRNRELHHPLRLLTDGAALIRQELASNPVALLFGSEKVGLSNKDLSHCDWLLHIPTADENVSMNLGQAVAVCLWELSRELPRAAQTCKIAVANAADVELIISVLLEALHASGYVNPRAHTHIEQTVRRLVHRLNLSAEDAKVWLGILRQIAWKLRHP
ncbi:MAG: TrmJ/YjtD family RNA methyltransferase [Acidobacteria bacterium]|nr:TrmJ/YjtD family RNA methyltransferase [Acidobacteriaceae bacterium]MBV9610766.1 TrmJ/YjtD family RNA methyltransferase [Acidobacteriota bacterium]